MLHFCLVGAGRIGQLHARHLASLPGTALAVVADIDLAAATKAAEPFGAEATTDAVAAIGRSDVDAVLIASASTTHAALIEHAVAAGKPVLCEKPIDIDLGRARVAARLAKESGVPVLIGFNRRFDASHGSLRARLAAGEIGEVEIVSITSRDPEPPPVPYLAKAPAALWRETMIHDLDMARWLLGEEPVSVAAMASNLIEPGYRALNEVDTAVVILRTARGRLCQINNSWRAVYGYDQRIEVLGSTGLLRSDNLRQTSVEHLGPEGSAQDRFLHFFLDRYVESYRTELTAFIAAICDGTPMPITAEDGLRALVLAEAAMLSAQTGAVVPVTYDDP